jgi:hypothetical protein
MSRKDATRNPPNQAQKCVPKHRNLVIQIPRIKVQVFSINLDYFNVWHALTLMFCVNVCVAENDAGDEVDLCLVTKASAHFNKLMEQFNCLMKIHTNKDANFQVELSKVLEDCTAVCNSFNKGL